MAAAAVVADPPGLFWELHDGPRLISSRAPTHYPRSAILPHPGTQWLSTSRRMYKTCLEKPDLHERFMVGFLFSIDDVRTKENSRNFAKSPVRKAYPITTMLFDDQKIPFAQNVNEDQQHPFPEKEDWATNCWRDREQLGF